MGGGGAHGVFTFPDIDMGVHFIHPNCYVRVLCESIPQFIHSFSWCGHLPCVQFSPFPRRLQLASWNMSLEVS